MIEKLVEIKAIERVDDIPLLWEQIKAMEVIRLVDKHFPQHANWEGELTAGEVIAAWMCFIISQGDHRLSHVEGWAAQQQHLLAALVGKAVRALDFSDDRLADLLTQLSELKPWRAFEQELSGQLLRVYDLRAGLVRVDSTTGKTYAGVSEGGLFQFGHSKDHRPDLAQVKINLATLDPLGLPLSTTVIAGDRADDVLYRPEISCVRTMLRQRGLTYVGDKKMAAFETRAFIASGGDYYLCPVGLNQLSQEERWQLITEFLAGKWEPQSVTKGEEAIGVGFEDSLEQTATLEGSKVEWVERRLAFRSYERAKVEAQYLAQRVSRAQSELLKLNKRKQGKRRLDSAALVEACTEIVKRHQVEAILNWRIETKVEEKQVRVWRNRPARRQSEERLEVCVESDQEALLKEQEQLGWSFYLTNQKASECSLEQAVLAYRDQYTIEQGLGRLKGRPLGLLPLFLKDDDRVVGLIHLLVIALRLLCLAQFVVRRKLAEAELESDRQIQGLYAGQASRAISRPTTERLLEAFKGINLLIGEDGKGQVVAWLTPLNELQKRILVLFGFSHDVYLRLVTNFQNLTPE
jgi:transposase